MPADMSRVKPPDHTGGMCGETLGFKSIMWNVVYSVCLLVCAITCAFGLANSDWVSNTSVRILLPCLCFCVRHFYFKCMLADLPWSVDVLACAAAHANARIRVQVEKRGGVEVRKCIPYLTPPLYQADRQTCDKVMYWPDLRSGRNYFARGLQNQYL